MTISQTERVDGKHFDAVMISSGSIKIHIWLDEGHSVDEEKAAAKIQNIIRDAFELMAFREC